LSRRSLCLALLVLALFLFPLLPSGGAPPATAADVRPAVAMQDDDRWGINHVDPASRPNLARDAGARWNRWEIRWDTIEATQGRYDFRDTDAAVSASVAAGLQINGILISTPSWAQDRQNNGLPSGLNRAWNDPANLWAKFVRDTATRYRGQVRAWEIWNEPDYAAIFWAGTVADYYQLLKVSYLTIKSVDPSAQVLIGGLAYWPNPGFLDELLRLMVADTGGRANNHYFDILAWHTYSRPSDVLDRVAQSREKLQSTVGVRPIWINETNVPAWDESPMNNYQPYPFSATVREQASYIIQAFAYAVVGGAQKLFIYRWQDTEWPEAYGMLRNTGAPRPSYTAFQVASRHFSGINGGLVQRHGNVEQIVMRRGIERISVVWNRSSARTTTNRMGAAALTATLVEQNGSTATIRAANGQYDLPLEAASSNIGNDAADYLAGGPAVIVVENLSSTAQTVEETSELIGYAGAWPGVRGTDASGQNVWRNASPGYGASIGFDGPSITWLTAKGPDRGMARVEVDGVHLTDLDLFSPNEVWQVPYTFGPFGSGTHIFTVSVLPQRPPGSSGDNVDIDAFTAEQFRQAPAPATPTPTSTPTPTVTPTATITMSPTITRSPTITLTPTITTSPVATLSPTVTRTATVSPTPSPTATPAPEGDIIIEADGIPPDGPRPEQE
jgi:hypothetical protein